MLWCHFSGRSVHVACARACQNHAYFMCGASSHEQWPSYAMPCHIISYHIIIRHPIMYKTACSIRGMHVPTWCHVYVHVHVHVVCSYLYFEHVLPEGSIGECRIHVVEGGRGYHTHTDSHGTRTQTARMHTSCHSYTTRVLACTCHHEPS